LAQGNRDGIAPFTFSSEKGRSAGRGSGSDRGVSVVPTTEERNRRGAENFANQRNKAHENKSIRIIIQTFVG
jgi:hypothetical protein